MFEIYVFIHSCENYNSTTQIHAHTHTYTIDFYLFSIHCIMDTTIHKFTNGVSDNFGVVWNGTNMRFALFSIKFLSRSRNNSHDGEGGGGVAVINTIMDHNQSLMNCSGTIFVPSAR